MPSWALCPMHGCTAGSSRLANMAAATCCHPPPRQLGNSRGHWGRRCTSRPARSSWRHRPSWGMRSTRQWAAWHPGVHPTNSTVSGAHGTTLGCTHHRCLVADQHGSYCLQANAICSSTHTLAGLRARTACQQPASWPGRACPAQQMHPRHAPQGSSRRQRGCRSRSLRSRTAGRQAGRRPGALRSTAHHSCSWSPAGMAGAHGCPCRVCQLIMAAAPTWACAQGQALLHAHAGCNQGCSASVGIRAAVQQGQHVLRAASRGAAAGPTSSQHCALLPVPHMIAFITQCPRRHEKPCRRASG